MKCALCKTDWETAEHLLLKCSVVQPVWDLFNRWLTKIVKQPFKIDQLFAFYQNWTITNIETRQMAARMSAEVIFVIWSKRNTVVFEKASCSSQDLIALFLNRLKTRIKADHARLNVVQFKAKWKGIASIDENKELIFDFIYV